MTAESSPPPRHPPRAWADGGRLNVELRLLGLLGFVWVVGFLQANVWLLLTIASDLDTTTLPWLSILLPHVIALAVLGASLLAELPVARWSRRGSLSSTPPPWPLLLGGFPLLPAAAIAAWKDRRIRSHRQPPTQEEIEDAFHRLVRLPRTTSLRFLTWAGLAYLAEALSLGLYFEWPRHVSLVLVALWLALLGPLAAIVASRARAILRPEYLTAPRDTRGGFRRTGDLGVKLIVNAVIASLGAVTAPLAAGYLWLWCHQAQVERAEAHRVADRVEDLVREGKTAAVGALLVEHPHVGVVVGGRAYGRTLPRATAGPLVDIDGDAEPELILRHGPHATVGVYLSSPRSLPVDLLVFSGACALLFAAAGIVTWGLLVRRDVRRATVQVAAVAGGAAPPRWEGPGLATAELRQLVGAVGRLVNRITETNVAKYVSIEKAKEADRLKSQFLANMSHDLRSPLNSILGFSELLSTGIDGPLAEEDRQLVQLIHASGRELLQQIDDILDTAKMEAGRMELHPEPTPPATLISRAIQNARQRQHGTIDFETTVAPGLPAAFVDPYRTVQALENVLVFASERMAGGTVSIALRQAFGERGRMVTVEVRTAVPPATADQLRRARHGFHRIPGHAGLGLGLPLATSILEVQGGNLEIEDLGVDMLFCARLPAPESRRAARLRADAS